MTRKLKGLGLALVAVFALGALSASAAQAASHHLTVPKEPSIVTATDHVNNVFEITGGEHNVTCNHALYEGTLSAKTNTEVTVTPTYKECQVDPPFGPSATVDVNHCAYILTGNTDAEGKHAPVHIECAKKPGTEEDTEITITYSLFGSSCVVHVPPQTPKQGVHYTQTTNATTGKKDVTVNVTVSGIKYTETGGGFCPATTTKEDGTLTGAATAQAYEHIKCKALEGTGSATEQGKTTPGTYYDECEGEPIDLELTTT